MKDKIYNYLLECLYPLPSCDTCQYFCVSFKRLPCRKCEGYSQYKLHKGHKADLERITRGIIKITQSKDRTPRQSSIKKNNSQAL